MWMGIEWFSEVQFEPIVKRLTGIGASYAYTLHLVHYSIIRFIKVHLKDTSLDNPWFLFLLAVLASNVVAYILARWAEGPLTRSIKASLYGWLPASRRAPR